jgi:hypothetical protein
VEELVHPLLGVILLLSCEDDCLADLLRLDRESASHVVVRGEHVELLDPFHHLLKANDAGLRESEQVDQDVEISLVVVTQIVLVLVIDKLDEPIFLIRYGYIRILI